MFCRSLSFCIFFFGHCVVCSSIYGFWLLLYYLCTTDLSQLFIKPVFSRVHVTRSLVSYVCFVDHCWAQMLWKGKKSLEIPKGFSESINRRTNYTMTKEKNTKGQRSTKHVFKTKDRVTWTLLKTGFKKLR
jgi:hypothetical protein